MINIILFDGQFHKRLLPLSFTKPVGDLRVGILTFRKRWEKVLECKVSYATQDYLSGKFPMSLDGANVFVCATYWPGEELKSELLSLKSGQYIVDKDGSLLGFRDDKESRDIINELNSEKLIDVLRSKEWEEIRIDVTPFLENCYDIFIKNGEAIESDFQLLTQGRKSKTIHDSNTLIGDNIFLEEGAKIQGAIINSETGPVYIGEDAEIMEGSVIRGPFAMCEHSVVKLSGKIYGPTTLGPYCKVGGEINNSVLQGYSNKGHDGFLGNSVLGEWCNLGADTNNSNLKNNYGEVKIWNYNEEGMKETGLQFCGLIMGDHSKSGINTMFNTGTVVGVSANVFGAGFPPKFIPSFTWGGAEELVEFRLDKSFEVAEKMCERRNIEFTNEDKGIFEQIFSYSSKFRKS